VVSDVVISLPRDQAIALFEWAYRFTVDHNTQLTHPADAGAIDQVASALEAALKEPFDAEYGQILQKCRESVVSTYCLRMGPNYSGWLEKLDYQDA
jgi:hypothetical protein